MVQANKRGPASARVAGASRVGTKRKRTASPPRTPKLAAACCSPIDALLEPSLFKSLCDPTRSLLAACIAKCGRACSVSEVAQCCDVDLSVVSRHLLQLAAAGVLQSTKQGRTVLYSLQYRELADRLRQLAAAIEACDPEHTNTGVRCAD